MYKAFEPAQVLTPFIECYWSWQVDPDENALDDILPDAAPEFIVQLASIPFVQNESGEWQRQPRAFLYCAAHRPLRLSLRKPMKAFAIRFRPWGVSRFSRQSMASMLDRAVLPADALNELGDALVQTVGRVRSDAERVCKADTLLEQALELPARYQERLNVLLDAAHGGRCSSTEMAKALSMSDRSFNRLWHDVVGIEPRKFIQLMRFHTALTMIDGGGELATVAADCGYSDQPHMARQIKAISGFSPSSLRRRLGNQVYRELYTARPGAPWQTRE